MKLVTIATFIVLTMLSSAVYAFEFNYTLDKPAVTIKKVCKDVLDIHGNVIINKNGTTKKSCRNTRVHNNNKGTKIHGIK
jgi:hypothetical protein